MNVEEVSVANVCTQIIPNMYIDVNYENVQIWQWLIITALMTTL